MHAPTLTLILDGDVPLDLFARSMRNFQRLIDALTREVGGKGEVVWVVDELVGGATATIRGETERLEDAERVANAFAVVGKSLERGEVIPYSPQVAHAARSLASVLNGKITAIRFETGDSTSIVTTNVVDHDSPYLAAYGAVEGRVETIRSRGRKTFTLYDSLNDLAVICALRPDQSELVRGAWDRLVRVEGWVKRDPKSGRPIEINSVESITILPEVVPGSYRRARGVAPARPSDEPIASVFRRLRDA